MSHWHDSMVDRPETDGAVYVTGWTISGPAVFGVILVVWVFAIQPGAVGTIREPAIWFRSPECKNLGWQDPPRSPPGREFRHKRPQLRERCGRFFACGIATARASSGSMRVILRDGAGWG